MTTPPINFEVQVEDNVVGIESDTYVFDGQSVGPQVIFAVIPAIIVGGDSGGGATTIGDVSGLQAALDGKQPIDSDLTALAALTAPATKLSGIAAGATVNSTDSQLRDRSTHTGTQSADTLTDGTTNKAFLATERTKLAGVATGATANSPNATLLARANHTGTQLAATISDFDTAADARVAASTKVNGSVNGTPTTLTLWKGTQAQYDAIATKDANTFYGITP